MNKDDLLKMLDLGGTDALPTDVGESVVTADDPPPAGAGGPSALEVDEWGLRRGRELLAESDRLRGLGVDEFGAADFFAAAFQPDPSLLPSCCDRVRHGFLAQMFDTPGYQSLHAATRLDDTASGIAAAAFAQQYAALKQEVKHTPEADESGREMATLRAVGRALAEAHAEADECHDAVAAVGIGPGSPGSNDPRAVAALYRRVRNDPTLRQICSLAGRYRRVAQSRQRRKATHGLDDVVGVELGGDIARLLPSELVKLAIPEFEWDAQRRLAERQSLCREYHATEPVGKGPVIVAVDESGSMRGDRGHTAKALALALAWVARQQRRWCALVAYSGDSGERLLALPARWDEDALLGWLAAFIGKGSDIDVPVREMPRMFAQLGAPPGVTDVVFVTDAQCRLSAEVKNQFLDWKASAKARLVTLVVGSDPGDLAAVSDETHRVGTLDAAEEGVGRVLSL